MTGIDSNAFGLSCRSVLGHGDLFVPQQVLARRRNHDLSQVPSEHARKNEGGCLLLSLIQQLIIHPFQARSALSLVQAVQAMSCPDGFPELETRSDAGHGDVCRSSHVNGGSAFLRSVCAFS